MGQQSWRGVTWEVGYDHFAAYVAERGSASVPTNFVCQGGFKLGAWLVGLP